MQNDGKKNFKSDGYREGGFLEPPFSNKLSWDICIYVYLGAGKHPSPLEKKKKEKKKKKKKKEQEVFELSKNIVPIKSYTSFLASPYI